MKNTGNRLPSCSCFFFAYLAKKKIIIIEWPERLQVKRAYDLKIIFEHIADGREISITSNNNDFKEWNENYK